MPRSSSPTTGSTVSCATASYATSASSPSRSSWLDMTPLSARVPTELSSRCRYAACRPSNRHAAHRPHRRGAARSRRADRRRRRGRLRPGRWRRRVSDRGEVTGSNPVRPTTQNRRSVHLRPARLAPSRRLPVAYVPAACPIAPPCPLRTLFNPAPQPDPERPRPPPWPASTTFTNPMQLVCIEHLGRRPGRRSCWAARRTARALPN